MRYLLDDTESLCNGQCADPGYDLVDGHDYFMPHHPG
jgi:hypothetical protein